MERRKPVLIGLAVLGLFTGPGLWAADPAPAREAWRWSVYTAREGLPSDRVLAAAEAKEGEVWAITREGPAYFDGYRWHPLPVQHDTLTPNNVLLLAAPSRGIHMQLAARIYSGSKDGLLEVPLPRPDGRDDILGMAVLPDQRVVVLRAGRLFSIGNGRAEPCEIPGWPADRVLRGIAQAGRGRVLLITERELLSLNDIGLTSLLRIEQGDFARWTRVAFNEAGQGLVALLTPAGSRGIWEIEPGQAPKRVDDTASYNVASVAVAPDGDACIAFETGEIRWRRAGKWRAVESVPEPLGALLAMTFGSTGDVWAASEEGLGLFPVGNARWKTWIPPGAGKDELSVNALLPLADGSVWIGHGDGLTVRRPDGSLQAIREIDGRAVGSVTGLARDREGAIWISSGLRMEGAYRYDGRQWTHFGQADGLAVRHIHRIAADRGGRLWFLGRNGYNSAGGYSTSSPGAFYYDEGKFWAWEHNDRLGGLSVYDFAEGANGEYWFATVAGLGRWAKGTWTLWNRERGLRVPRIFCLAVDRQNRLWFGDQQSGLGYISEEKPRYFTSADGLVSDAVWGLDVDEAGRLWIATRGGLGCYDQGRWESFRRSSGLASVQLWPIKATPGRIITGTSGGGTAVLERSTTGQNNPRVDLPPPAVDGSSVVLRWTPISYFSEKKTADVETRFRLDDGAFSPWSLRRETVVTSLSPGLHHFQVQVRGFFGSFDPAGSSVVFRIPRPFYQEPLFLVPLGALAAALVVLLVVYRLRRRRFLAVISESEQRYRRLSEHIADAVITTDLAGRIDYANAQFWRMFGLPGPAEAGLVLADLVADSDRAEVRRHYAGDEWRDQGRSRFQCVGLRRDGSSCQLDVSSVSFHDTAGRVVGVQSTIRDITEIKQLERNLAQARDQALEVSRLKSEFMATMSHEIRTPMNAVLGMAELLADSPLTDEQAEMVRTMSGGAETLLSIINDILDFSRIEAGRLRLESAEFDVRQVIEEVVALLATQAQAKDLELTCEFGPGEAWGVLGDGGRLRQVMTNLLGNALKFTERGEVAVCVTVQPPAGAPARRELRVTIRDTGIGIPRAAQAQLFQPFIQADGSATRRFGGTGLGLAISRQLIELMGGRIGFESEEGRGSTFWFELSLPARGGAGPAPLASIPSGRRILVVDDNPTNRRILQAQLQRLGIESREVASGVDALAVLRDPSTGSWDAVVLDWHMPGQSGLEVAGEIRREPSGAALPLVLLSSVGISLDAAQVAELRFAATLTKPVLEAPLARCLARVLTGGPSTGSRAPSPPTSNRKEAIRLKVLVAEDNVANQRVATMLLAKFGHEAELVTNGAEVLARLPHRNFDVVLMDCQMPVLDGYETTRRIRSGLVAGVNPRIPIIALTAYARPEDRERCLAAGMDDHVTKPIRSADLLQALERRGFRAAETET